MSRHEERESVFGLLYEYNYHTERNAETFLNDRKIKRDSEEEAPYSDYVCNTFNGVMLSVGELDRTIEKYLKGWKLSRLSKVSLAILRLAVYEIVFTETPVKAVINEAVELAKEYAEDKAPAFINGVLNNVARAEGKIGDTAETPESETAEAESKE